LRFDSLTHFLRDPHYNTMAPNDLLRHRVRIRAESKDREEDESDIASSGQPSGGSDSDDVLEAEPDAVEDGASPVGGSEDEVLRIHFHNECR
jgi:hypothetical protein